MLRELPQCGNLGCAIDESGHDGGGSGRIPPEWDRAILSLRLARKRLEAGPPTRQAALPYSDEGRRNALTEHLINIV